MEVLGIFSKPRRVMAALVGAAGILGVAACSSSRDAVPPGHFQVTGSLPPSPKLGQLHVDPVQNRDYIYSGTAWVACPPLPGGPGASGAGAVPGLAPPGSDPMGAHPKHSSYSCRTCHDPHGILAGGFYVGGLAYLQPSPANPNPPPPRYDYATQTCSNVACHGIPAGNFSYYFQGGDGSAELKTVLYGGYVSTPPWYSTGQGCSACHGNPPSPQTSGGWHYLQAPHVRNQPNSQDCSFCHPDATGVGTGTAVTNPALHRNGKVDVQAKWTHTCEGCH